VSIFGPIIDANQVEEAVRDTLRDWFPTYLREFCLQRSMPPDSLPIPRAYVVSGDNDREPEDQLPAVVVVSPGLSESAYQEGDGTFRAPWAVGVGIFTSAKDRESTEKLVRMYCAVARTIMLQKQSLGGFADGTMWLDEDFDEVEFDDTRTIGAGLVEFVVTVANVVNRRGGPAYPDPPDPDEQPGSNWPLVDEVIIDEQTMEEV
jgi:hypothetical protein